MCDVAVYAACMLQHMSMLINHMSFRRLCQGLAAILVRRRLHHS